MTETHNAHECVTFCVLTERSKMFRYCHVTMAEKTFFSCQTGFFFNLFPVISVGIKTVNTGQDFALNIFFKKRNILLEIIKAEIFDNFKHNSGY